MATPPRLRLVDVETGQVELRELAGRALGFRVVGDDGVRYCVGRSATDEATGGSRCIPCPTMAPAVVSGRCADCAAKDTFRFVHTVHRQDFVSRDLRAIVMQPHWLYVATFAGGQHKVGTATDGRKWGRLAEQGAICARYVAYAVDGRAVRVAEDLATERLGLRQAVRASAKATALCAPVDVDRLGRATDLISARVRTVLEEVSIAGCSTVDGAWSPPSDRGDLARHGHRIAYPATLWRGHHGFDVDSCIGQSVIARIGSETFVVDLAALAGCRIVLGDFVTDLPGVQSVLF